ncbi:MAG: VOC family protein [Magnetovibrio sp.]|nr:VOC family protein [Magnetovibrio sp.]
MLDIKAVDHVGIRIRERARSTAFYQVLGFDLVKDAGFAQGHPIIMRHPSGVVLNLLGPSSVDEDHNILMDVEQTYTGITHVALQVGSLAAAKTFLAEAMIEITGQFSFGEMHAVFIRDPDRNVIELDAYEALTD